MAVSQARIAPRAACPVCYVLSASSARRMSYLLWAPTGQSQWSGPPVRYAACSASSWPFACPSGQLQTVAAWPSWRSRRRVSWASAHGCARGRHQGAGPYVSVDVAPDTVHGGLGLGPAFETTRTKGRCTCRVRFKLLAMSRLADPRLAIHPLKSDDINNQSIRAGELVSFGVRARQVLPLRRWRRPGTDTP